ncbi:MAG: leucine-rich repeat domain-containing protein [Planctomycetota bacterium]|jgi:Leucine-rich repeat (LRR) protein|nr:leucine-rich repeat domain-containing protein [Planctomycetota bacterium]
MFVRRLTKWQFSLRTFLAICILIGIYLGVAIPRAQQQKKAADWVRSFGRTPYYSYQFDPNGNYTKTHKPWGPNWFRELLGIDFFYAIRMVHLDDKHVGDISNISKLHGLKHLEVASCSLTSIEPLSELKSLEVLSINENRISDLTPLRNCRHLHLLSASSNASISDISVVKSLPNLRVLYIDGTDVSDLAPLHNHRALEYLNISVTQVKSLEPLKSIKTLKTLKASSHSITDEEIANLQAAFPNLSVER